MDCGFEVPYPNEVDQRFQCPICLLVMRSPVQTACGHRFCGVCIKQVIQFKNSVLTCPVDKTYTKVNQIFPDLAIEREILSMKVQCTNALDGCSWTGELRELEKHRLSCEMESVLCPNGCALKVKRKDQDDHVSHCPHRYVQCQHCTERIVLHMLEDHHEKCLKKPVACSLCTKVFPREELGKHQNPDEGQCPNVVVRCPYNYIGCTFQAQRQLMTDHTRGPEALSEHMNFMLSWMAQHGRAVQELERSVNDLHEKNRSVLPELLQNDKKQKQVTNELMERNVTGKLHWKLKIGDMRQRCTSYTSPAFYTGCPGYKVQLILDMDGPREGNTRYTNLSLTLLRGDYDNQVVFPFNATCIVTLYDQMKCPPHEKVHNTSQLVIREVPRNNNESTTQVERIYKREISKYISRPDLTGPSSRYMKNGCLHFEVTVIHSYYPPDGCYHVQGCYCTTLHNGLEMAVSPKWTITPRTNSPAQAQLTPIMQVAAIALRN